MIRLTLPVPPSANKRLTRGHRLTAEAREYLETAAWDAEAQMLEQGDKMCRRHCEVSIKAYQCKHDVDNLLKLLLDCLKGVAFEDDKLVDKLTVERIREGERRLEVEITER